MAKLRIEVPAVVDDNRDGKKDPNNKPAWIDKANCIVVTAYDNKDRTLDDNNREQDGK